MENGYIHFRKNQFLHNDTYVLLNKNFFEFLINGL